LKYYVSLYIEIGMVRSVNVHSNCRYDFRADIVYILDVN
jgi:hypothetical protein